MVPVSNDPSSAVSVWASLSALVTVSVVPAGTVSSDGPKEKSWIVIAAATAAGWVLAEVGTADDDGVVVAVVGATVVVDAPVACASTL